MKTTQNATISIPQVGRQVDNLKRHELLTHGNNKCLT